MNSRSFLLVSLLGGTGVGFDLKDPLELGSTDGHREFSEDWSPPSPISLPNQHLHPCSQPHWNLVPHHPRKPVCGRLKNGGSGHPSSLGRNVRAARPGPGVKEYMQGTHLPIHTSQVGPTTSRPACVHECTNTSVLPGVRWAPILFLRLRGSAYMTCSSHFN